MATKQFHYKPQLPALTTMPNAFQPALRADVIREEAALRPPLFIPHQNQYGGSAQFVRKNAERNSGQIALKFLFSLGKGICTLHLLENRKQR